MNKLIPFFIFLALISCRTKKYTEVYILPAGRPQYEKQIPTDKNYKLVDSFFNEWSKTSIPISESEFAQSDTLIKKCYEIYESIMSDTSVLNVNLNSLSTKFILVPNTIHFGYVTNYKIDYGMLFFEDSNIKKIENFRPRLKFKNKKILYYTKEYRDTFPSFAEKYGIGSFLEINCYLMSNFPLYFETQPVITGIINILSTNKYIIQYRYRNGSYESLLEHSENKWIKIEDLTHLESD